MAMAVDCMILAIVTRKPIVIGIIMGTFSSSNRRCMSLDSKKMDYLWRSNNSERRRILSNIRLTRLRWLLSPPYLDRHDHHVVFPITKDDYCPNYPGTRMGCFHIHNFEEWLLGVHLHYCPSPNSSFPCWLRPWSIIQLFMLFDYWLVRLVWLLSFALFAMQFSRFRFVSVLRPTLTFHP